MQTANLVNEELYLQSTALTQKKFDDNYKCVRKLSKKKSLWSRHVKPIIKRYNPSKLFSIFTIFSVISNYNIKECLVADIFSGITVGVMQIPQVILLLAKSTEIILFII